ncbi:hypothetical protein Hanom_Chr01g00042661 [Helianthus anomalus]
MERVEQDDDDGYPYLGNETGGNNISDMGNEEYDTTPGTAPVRGIGLRVTNIEGNPLMPRRGVYSTNNRSVLDGLEAISSPVNLDFHANPKSTNVHANPKSSGPSNTDLHVDGNMQPQVGKGDLKTSGPQSFARVVQANKEPMKVNFRHMESDEQMEDVDVVIPVASVKQVNERFANTLYGYFLGKRLAFPVVEYFVKNQWAKYGLIKIMMNAKGFFFFKFKTKQGLEQVLEDGPWTIRNVPIILNEWSPSVMLVKEDITAIAVWVKLIDVPLQAFTEDGLSLLASKVGMPKMLDSYTASMCAESWGRSSFARAMIEVNAGAELKRSIKIAVPSLEGNGFSKVDVKVEYDWEPSRCSTCVFGHDDKECPKKPKAADMGGSIKDADGFKEFKGKSKNGTQQGIQLKNQKPKMVYRGISKNKSNGDNASTSTVRTSNPFDVLQEEGVDNTV